MTTPINKLISKVADRLPYDIAPSQSQVGPSVCQIDRAAPLLVVDNINIAVDNSNIFYRIFGIEFVVESKHHVRCKSRY